MKTPGSILNALKGISGEFEIGRLSLAVGGIFAVSSPIGFEAYEIGWNGGHFDVTTWCLAYGAMLTGLISGGVFIIGNKEKQVAVAQTVRDTGLMPGNAPTDGPAEVKVINNPSNPVPVEPTQ